MRMFKGRRLWSLRLTAKNQITHQRHPHYPTSWGRHLHCKLIKRNMQQWTTATVQCTVQSSIKLTKCLTKRKISIKPEREREEIPKENLIRILTQVTEFVELIFKFILSEYTNFRNNLQLFM